MKRERGEMEKEKRKIGWKFLSYLYGLVVTTAIAFSLAKLYEGRGFRLTWFETGMGAVQFMVLSFALPLILFVVFHGVLGINSPDGGKLVRITNNIYIPPRSRSTEKGSSWWMQKKEIPNAFASRTINYSDKVFQMLINDGGEGNASVHIESQGRGGFVIGMERKGSKETIYYSDENHTLTIGSTGSGKSRTLVMPSIFNLALAGESMIITDVKKELYLSTSGTLRNLGYKVHIIDFKNPQKSEKYNILQPVIDACRAGNFDRAEMFAMDLAESLVGDDTHNEKIWSNGEKSVIAFAVLSVVSDAMDYPEFQNLATVYWHIVALADKQKLAEYMRSREHASPASKYAARKVEAASRIAPDKTKGSFYTSAITTLNLFSSASIYRMTNASEMDFRNLGKEKTALFIVLPDEKATFYPVATLLVAQIYQLLVEVSDQNGGELPVRVNYILDEFGNFTKINDFESMITMGRSRGVRFNLFVQNTAQIVQKYGKEQAETIMSNCETWIYLKTDTPETRELISKKLGEYTVKTTSRTHSERENGGSSSQSLATRPLLYPAEVGRIERPYQLILSSGKPLMMKTVLLEDSRLDKIYGIGSKSDVSKMRMRREAAIPLNDEADVPVDRLYSEFWSKVVRKENKEEHKGRKLESHNIVLGDNNE